MVWWSWQLRVVHSDAFTQNRYLDCSTSTIESSSLFSAKGWRSGPVDGIAASTSLRRNSIKWSFFCWTPKFDFFNVLPAQFVKKSVLLHLVPAIFHCFVYPISSWLAYPSTFNVSWHQWWACNVLCCCGNATIRWCDSIIVALFPLHILHTGHMALRSFGRFLHLTFRKLLSFWAFYIMRDPYQ